jgi:hypothetical protein
MRNTEKVRRSAAPNLLVQFSLAELTLQLTVDPSKSRRSIPAKADGRSQQEPTTRADGRSQQKPTVDPSKSRRLIPTIVSMPPTYASRVSRWRGRGAVMNARTLTRNRRTAPHPPRSGRSGWGSQTGGRAWLEGASRRLGRPQRRGSTPGDQRALSGYSLREDWCEGGRENIKRIWYLRVILNFMTMSVLNGFY